jgi:hypothetical protein
MGTISPGFSPVQIQGRNTQRVIWADIVTGDTIESFGVAGPAAVAGAVQFGGTFGGATIKLQSSNDGTTFFDMKDVYGVVISATAAALFEFSTSAVYLRPAISGGSANAVDVTLSLRG